MARYKVKTPPTNTPGERDSELSLFRKKADKNLFNLVDSETIRLSGSRVSIYKYVPSNDVDEVYMESRQKTISPTPIKVWAHYDPRPIEENLSEFGVEIQYDQVFIFNKSYLVDLLGRDVIPGDVIEPEFQDVKFQVHEVQEDSFESYGVYHLMAHATLLRDTGDVSNEDYTDVSDNIGGKY
tara:strand:- start:1485 stop:2030 length:546 start_codon:yes stop_codon:yes gene_type:complete